MTRRLKLSRTMTSALEAIEKHGGVVRPCGRGSWEGADGNPLPINVLTVRALYTRGYLTREPYKKRVHDTHTLRHA